MLVSARGMIPTLVAHANSDLQVRFVGLLWHDLSGSRCGLCRSAWPLLFHPRICPDDASTQPRISRAGAFSPTPGPRLGRSLRLVCHTRSTCTEWSHDGPQPPAFRPPRAAAADPASLAGRADGRRTGADVARLRAGEIGRAHV